MTAPIVQIDYERMRFIARHFPTLADEMTGEFREVCDQVDRLKSGHWVADAATTYYRQMDNEILPGLARLADALSQTGETLDAVIQIFQSGEEDASALLGKFKQEGGVEGGGERPPWYTEQCGPGDDGGTMGASIEDAAIIFVPGAGTQYDTLDDELIDVSEAFGGSPVMAVYNRSDGKFQDFTQAFNDQMEASWGENIRLDGSNPAVASLVRQLETTQQHPIQLVAHSQGAAITAAALRIYEDKYGSDALQNIEVTTMGGFGVDYPAGPEYHHYVHSQDVVPYVAYNTNFDAGVFDLARTISNVTVVPASDIMQGSDYYAHSLDSYLSDLGSFQAEEAAADSSVFRHAQEIAEVGIPTLVVGEVMDIIPGGEYTIAGGMRLLGSLF